MGNKMFSEICATVVSGDSIGIIFLDSEGCEKIFKILEKGFWSFMERRIFGLLNFYGKKALWPSMKRRWPQGLPWIEDHRGFYG